MKNKKIYLVIVVFLMALLISGGTLAYWNWSSSENKTVVFNTSKNIQEYIVYDEGESKFVGDFKVGNSYLDGVHTTVSIHKTGEAANIILYATINMRIKEIGTNLANSEGLKWVITSGDSTSGGEILAIGDFYGGKSNDEFIILDNIEVTETLTSYTVWIWLDEGYATSEMTGEKIDTAIWTQVNQYPENNFEITNLSNNYQVINATVVNSNNNIVSYAITDSNVEPVKNKIDKVVASPLVSRSNDSELTMLADSTNWIDIPVEEQKKVYVLKYVVNSTGTYYLWFKDSSGKVINKEIKVSNISTDKPVCTWSNPGNSAIKDGESTTITLTCIDPSSKIMDSDISISDITVSSTSITVLDNIVKERITNGYKYTFTVSTGSDLGIGTITIPTNLIINEFNLGNDEVISSNIAYSSVYNITYKDVGDNEFSGVHEDGYPETYNSGAETILDLPSKNGYTFYGYYLTSDGSGNKTPSISNTQTGNITLYAKWVDNKPYGVANLSLIDGIFTLSLSNHGDDGSGLTGTYGFALISNGSCESATYEYQTELSKTYSENLNNNVEYYGCIKLEDNDGNITYVKSSGIEYLYNVGTETYTTSGEYEFTVPATGTYKLEVWGAQGGVKVYAGSSTVGYGGYSVGNINLTIDEILYINVGGSGKTTSSKGVIIEGGYNGGGAGYSYSGDSRGGASGGGATHIATISGELKKLSPTTDIDKVLIVAGGGGGSDQCCSGYSKYPGSGGGFSGVIGKYNGSTVSSGTQTNGGGSGDQVGTFGQGGSCSKNDCAGGGGGYYGGGAAIGGGGYGSGGSGYIGNNLLTDKYMYCYNCTTSDEVGTKTYTTTNVSDTPTSDYAKSGDGAARITWDMINNQSTIILTYDNQGGTGCYSKSVTSGSTYGELCAPVKDGYIFNGWYTESSSGSEITSSTIVSETVDHTIYAHWIEATNPVITFSNNGSSGYVSGNISSTITVSKGSSDLDYNSFKYIYSTDRNATPDTIFYRGYEYTLENATGIYYLIAKACDVNGNCTTEVSNPFYVDNEIPTVEVTSMTSKLNTLTVNVSANDTHSGVSGYGYLIQTDSTCPATGYVSSNNSSYTFNVSSSGVYYVCVKIIDNVGNVNIISDSVLVEFEINYENISSNYSCANSSAGTTPIFTYTGNCQIINDGNGDYRIKFLTSGEFTNNVSLNVDLFLVGGGGGGGSDCDSDPGFYCQAGGGGGGGYTKTYKDVSLSVTSYAINIGSGGGVGGSGGTSYFGDSSTYFANGGGAGTSSSGGSGGSGGGSASCCRMNTSVNYYSTRGNGGSFGSNGSSCSADCPYHSGSSGGSGQGSTTCEFGLGTVSSCNSGVTVYSKGGTGSTWIKNSGNGGNVSGSGSSGIVIMRNKR